MKFSTEKQKEIAKYAIEHDNDFKSTGEKNGISYQQVAAWVRKYKSELTADDTKKKSSAKKPTSAKKSSTKKTAAKKAPAKKAQPKSDKQTEDQPAASTLDVLSRKDPVLEKQLEDVKRRLGLL